MVDTSGGAKAPPLHFEVGPLNPRPVKRLVVNADDFGFARDVNEGVLRSHLNGIVSSTSLMANGAAFDHAVNLAARHPSLAVGCHLTLVQGESVARPGASLPSSVARLLASFPTREAILAEFRAQIEKLVQHGVRPTHLDTHKHVHLLPPVLDAMAAAADEFGVGWIRKPFDIPFGMAGNARSWVAMALRPFRIPFEERLDRANCATTDYFAGFASTGSMDAAWLIALFAALPPGMGELVCHPGLCGPELSAAPTKLKESREAELSALCDPAVRRAAERHGIEILSYRDL